MLKFSSYGPVKSVVVGRIHCLSIVITRLLLTNGRNVGVAPYQLFSEIRTKNIYNSNTTAMLQLRQLNDHLKTNKIKLNGQPVLERVTGSIIHYLVVHILDVVIKSSPSKKAN